MFVFNGKRILFIFACVSISICSFLLSNISNNKSMQASSTPISGSLIIIDAGHGYPDEGANSSDRNN